MPNPIDENPASRVCLLVQFEYETSPTTFVRYAAWESDVTLDGDTFTAKPAIAVKLPKLDGTVRGTDTEITMEEIAPISSMRTTFPPVTVTIWELDPADETTAYKLYKGVVTSVEYNYNGNPNAARVKVSGPKRLLETTLSMKMGRFCPWTFGQRPCNYDRNANKETATISTILGTQITLSSPLTETNPTFWKFGGVRYRGFEVSIHRFESPTVLHTVRPVPAHWQGLTVDILPGCDKTIEVCRVRGREAEFGALGILIPNRDVRISEQ